MQPIRKQIVYDEQHRPVQVVIPYEDWQKLEALLSSSNESNASALMGFFGKIDFKGDPVAIQRKMRSEWPD